MSRMNRRRFTWVATSGFASAALVACSGSDAVKDDITPTRIADVEGAPPTLAPNATPFSASDQGGGGAAAPSSGPITVTGHDSLTFDPSAITATPGQVIHFVNGGALQHDLNVDELGMKMEPIDGGAEADVTVPEDAAPGDYTYYCSVPGHREAGMEGTLTVVEAGSQPAGGGDQAAAAPSGEPITVTGQDSLSFDPSSFQAMPGQTIHFVNGGMLQHDFIVDELGITMDPVDGGGEVDVTVPADAAPGDYTYYCSLPGHREAGMEGTMTVVEAGAAPSSGAATEEATPEEAATEEATPEEAAATGGGAPAGPIEVHTLDALQFDPSEIEASPGQEIHVINDGVMQHDFIIDELEMATDLLNNGEDQTITVPDDAEVGQSYTYYCSVPGHRQAGMEGTITIVEGGGGAAAAAPEEASTPTEETAAAPSGPVDASQPVEVHTLDALQFDPAEITVAPGQTIHVVNDGALQHDFVVDEWGLATALLNNSESDDIVVPDDAEIGASYTYYCSVPGHAAAGMQGTLTVAEAAGGEAAATEAPGEASPAAEGAAAEGATPEAELDADVIRVAALDSMRFAPSQFSAAPGQQIYLLNRGVLIHDIVVDEWGLDTGPLGGGESSVFNIPDDVEVGAEIEFYCSVPGHRESGMVGTITIIEADVEQQAAVVTPAAGASPAAEAATPAATEEAAAASPAAAGASPVAAGGEAVEVHCVDIAFEPTELAIPADTDVQIRVINKGFLEHDFTIEDTDFATDLLPGASDAEETITVNLPAGEYAYFCSVPGHRAAGMEGTLTVE